MMRSYSVRAAYMRHIESQLALAIAEGGRDVARGNVIESDRIDAEAAGTGTILVGSADEVSAMLLAAKREGYALALALTGPQPVTEKDIQYYRERAQLRIPDEAPDIMPLSIARTLRMAV